MMSWLVQRLQKYVQKQIIYNRHTVLQAELVSKITRQQYRLDVFSSWGKPPDRALNDGDTHLSIDGLVTFADLPFSSDCLKARGVAAASSSYRSLQLAWY
eukprot:Filipodium_phascolosomae@DN2531_c0_g1_i2.p1